MCASGYAERLTKGVWKGKCGLPEQFDAPDELERKVEELAQLVRQSSHLVVYTGAGVSTAAGIRDFRGPNGVWTAEERGETSTAQGTRFENAKPTLTHMALVALHRLSILKFVVTQNVDNLHTKSGLPRNMVAELHGNVFKETCEKCQREYIGTKELPTVGFKLTGNTCECGGLLRDTVLDWFDALPEKEMSDSDDHSKKADLALCLGTSLQIVPARNLPLKATRKHSKSQPGKMVIVNLQKTPLDGKAHLIIRAKCDDVMTLLMQKLSSEIPVYNEIDNKRLFTLKEETDDADARSGKRYKTEPNIS